MKITQNQKPLTGGEWVTLAGMALAVMSPALKWAQQAPLPVASLGAVYVARTNYALNGYELHLGWLPVGWTVVAAAVVCACLLLLEPTASDRRRFLALQTALAATILVLAFLHVGPYPGVTLAILGGLLLLAGALLRYR